ncbi:alkaline phosphatase PhoX [Crocinitomix catalasitica]|uniref:alkaline phosphatase PhoX n=1 Tax=Crocinitomix catalasitica TaxID=184607 RepID=UPI00048683DE|nr:alkaline phosphatase PhoX [Crocinitomix catalasitica]
MKFIVSAFALFVLAACTGSETEREAEVITLDSIVTEEMIEVIDTTPPFIQVDPIFDSQDLVLPEGFTYRVIFQEKTDLVTRADGKKFPAKGNHDLSVFIPDEKAPETKGLIYISHETKYADPNLGDGGGATVFGIELIDGQWQVTSDFDHVDFAPVGYTNRNCGGSLTPNNTVFSCEETWAWNTEALYRGGEGHTDTSWVNGLAVWQNMGYVVEVDPRTREVIQKHYKLGKFVHEDALCTPDGKTVYLTDDMSPGIFFKYETFTPYDYSDGQLFAYQQTEDGESGNWLKLPMDTISLIYCRDTAIARGATMFIRHEWIEEVNGKLYINETGEDSFSWARSIARGGTVPNYMRENLAVGETDFDDTFGRVLEFDPVTNKMSVLLEGGFIEDSLHCFSNPDCNTSVRLNGRDYLVLSEDINWYSRGRVSPETEKRRLMVNEIYFLPLDIENPSRADLLRFCVAPIGAETTGVIFLPDGSMLMNIMHPSTRNNSKLNKSSTVIVEGFKK